jgi:hypothetical protein
MEVPTPAAFLGWNFSGLTPASNSPDIFASQIGVPPQIGNFHGLWELFALGRMQRNARNSNDPDLLKTRDVCQTWQVCRRTVDYWRERNLLAYVKVGGAVRFLRSDVEQFIRSHRVGGSPG